MVSDQLASFLRWLENKLNTHSSIKLSTDESVLIVNHLKELEADVRALEETAVPPDRRHAPYESGNVVRLDLYKIRKGKDQCTG